MSEIKIVSGSYSDIDSDSYNKEKIEKFNKKHHNLMQQRLRGRTAKTTRLQKSSTSSYKDSIDKSDDVYKHWENVKNKDESSLRNVLKTIKPSSNVGKGIKRRKTKKNSKQRRNKTLRKRKN